MCNSFDIVRQQKSCRSLLIRFFFGFTSTTYYMAHCCFRYKYTPLNFMICVQSDMSGLVCHIVTNLPVMTRMYLSESALKGQTKSQVNVGFLCEATYHYEPYTIIGNFCQKPYLSTI